jgi:hypothetical protein
LKKVNAVDTENWKAHIEMRVEPLPFSGTSGNELAAQLSVRFGTNKARSFMTQLQ